jgi:catechol-2,3-dioxygenase
MNIVELTLKTHCPHEMYEFYVDTLGFTLLDESDDHFTLDAGDSRLTFQVDESQPFVYHFAFNIPHNQLADAQLWLMQRADLLPDAAGHTIIQHSPEWDSKALYLYDPAGNIIEFVARYRIPTCSDIPFSGQSVLSISEVGLVVDDVPKAAASFSQQLGIQTFGTSAPNFHALGDDNGLLILSQKGRIWYPTSDVQAQYAPVQMTLAGVLDEQVRLGNYPYAGRITRS